MMRLRQSNGFMHNSFRCVLLFLLGAVLAACTTTGSSNVAMNSTVGKTDYNQTVVPVDTKTATLVTKKTNNAASAKVSAFAANNVKKNNQFIGIVGQPYQVNGKWYRPTLDESYSKTGHASWYGSKFHGRLTANGEIYNKNLLTAAHPTMPLPSYARVVNLENGSSLVVRVNDRGPFAKNRIIDLSEKAADMLDYKDDGTTNVKVEYLGPAPKDGHDESFLIASFKPAGETILLSISEDVATADQSLPSLPEIGPILALKPSDISVTAYNQIKLPPMGPNAFSDILTDKTY